MTRGILLASAVALACSGPAPASPRQPSTGAPRPAGDRTDPACATSFFPAPDRIRETLQPYVDTAKARGMVIGLIEPDGRRRVMTFGDGGTGTPPLSGSSVFETGSIVKSFTGVVLAEMVERGEVKFDDPVAKYLPATVRMPTSNGRQVTLLDLATHMSGLPRFPTDYTSPDPDRPYATYAADDLYRTLGKVELAFEPGTKMSYSNLGMGLLGHALARAARVRDYQTLVVQRVIHPLGRSMTRFGRPPSIAPWMTVGHDQAGKIAPYMDVDVLAGGGGLNSTAADLMTYLSAVIAKAETPLGRALTTAASEHRAGSRPGEKLGLGWMGVQFRHYNFFGIRGGTAGYSAYISFDPATRAGVVVLANSGEFDHADKIGRDLLYPQKAYPAAQ